MERVRLYQVVFVRPSSWSMILVILLESISNSHSPALYLLSKKIVIALSLQPTVQRVV